MPVVSIIWGALLIALGLWGYYGPDVGLFQATVSPTALIPAGVGAVLLVCGLLALKESLLKHAMHAAALVGLLGFLAAAARFVPRAVGGADFRSPAVISTGLMTLLCGTFVALCVNSFIQARRRRAAREGAAVPPNDGGWPRGQGR